MYRKIYFMGIKGVGMSTLAVMAKQAGFIVSGSDVEEEFITDKILKETRLRQGYGGQAGIDVRLGFKKENPEDFFDTNPKDECLFIATAAHGGFDNPEAKFAHSINIKVISHGEAVGLFMSGKLFERNNIEGISVSGSHGKTTIAAMISTFLAKLGSDPSFAVGTSEINPIGAAGHYGLGKYFVAEADEYLSEMKYDRIPKFLYQHPKYLIINNIDFDHPDFFRDIDDVKDAYAKFISQLDRDSILIVNGDDSNIKSITSIKGTTSITGNNNRIRIITYGTDATNEFVIKNFKQEGFDCRFEVLRNNTSLGNFELSVPGYHNAKNSLAAIALLTELGFSASSIQKVMPEFRGSKRRLERIGKTGSGAEIFDDYAHHPEEIRKTLEALRLAYPAKKITLIFQAHTFGRTKALMPEFVSAFAGVAELIILPTFASARSTHSARSGQAREDVQEDLALDLAFVERIRAVQPNVKLIETREGVVEYIDKNITSPNCLILTMGAGDVYKISEKLKVKS